MLEGEAGVCLKDLLHPNCSWGSAGRTISGDLGMCLCCAGSIGQVPASTPRAIALLCAY